MMKDLRVATMWFAGSVCLSGCQRPTPITYGDADAQATTPPVASIAAKASPPAPTPLEQVKAATTLQGALAIATPRMSDEPNELGLGTLMLMAWAARSMKWADVGVSTDETSFAKVLKDAEEERGKRLCATGIVVQIAVEKTEFGKFHEGLMMSDAGNIYRFLGVGSSGEIVQQQRARFCGVVTGRYDYSNSAGGTGHAIKLVGMFDLPANRKAAVTTMASSAPSAQ